MSLYKHKTKDIKQETAQTLRGNKVVITDCEYEKDEAANSIQLLSTVIKKETHLNTHRVTSPPNVHFFGF